jgi:hypothetical protein
MARWIRHISPNDPDIVGDTIIAGWWPFTFHRVVTWRVKAASASDGVLALQRKMFGADRDYFVTIVQKTDRNGFAKLDDSEFETRYPDQNTAREGHARIVAGLARGSLPRFTSGLEK